MLTAALGAAPYPPGVRGYEAIRDAINKSKALKNNPGVKALIGQTFVYDRATIVFP